MAQAEVFSGACAFTTVIRATMEGAVCKLAIKSECQAIQRLADALTEVNPYREISFRRGMPQTLAAGAKYCNHPACPVPVGIIKAVELEAKLNLPRDVTIKLSA